MKRHFLNACGLAGFALLLVVPPASGQLILPEIAVDVQRLSEEARLKLVGIDSTLSAFLSDPRQNWNRDEGAYDLPVQINIYFTEYSPNPQEDKFKANLIISNKRELRFDDKRWEFGLRTPYRPQTGSYDPFTSVLEFYLWVLIGNEEDKYEKLGGNRYYDRARQVELASTSSIYFLGWDKRRDLLREITDEKNRVYRELIFFYFTGLYFDEERDWEQAKPYLHYALIKLEELRIDQRTAFLEGEHAPLARALANCRYQKGMDALQRLDPAHRDTYREIFGAADGQ